MASHLGYTAYMFHYVYVLRSLKDGEFYTGSTEDLRSRVNDHNTGKNVSTRKRRPFELIYYEAYRNKHDALGREKFLKSGSGKRFLSKQLRHFLGR